MAEKDESAPVVNPIEHMLDRLTVNTVFGTPTHMGDVTIIPVASIRTGFGFGYGAGPVEKDSNQSASGGGGGGTGAAKPMGYVRVAPDGVQYEGMADPTRITLAGIFLAGWIVYWVTRTIREVARRR